MKFIISGGGEYKFISKGEKRKEGRERREGSVRRGLERERGGRGYKGDPRKNEKGGKQNLKEGRAT